MRRTPSQDEGFVIPAVLGVVALITVIAMSGFFLAKTTLGESTRVDNENRAYQAAASGLERELSVFTPGNFATGTSANGYVYGSTRGINGRDWFVVTVKTPDQDHSLSLGEYEMLSIGGSEDTTESVRVRFMSFNLWDMNISGSENSNVGSGAGFNGNGVIIGTVYCNGDFEWSGNGSLEAGPIFVRNGVFTKQSTGSNVGFSGDTVAAYLDNPPVGVDGNTYIDLKGSAPKLDVPWPMQADMDNWKKMATDDSKRNKLGPSATRHPDSASDVEYNIFTGNVTFDSNFGRAGYASQSGSMDETGSGDVIAVNNGTLYINGTVYIDGVLTIGPSIRQYAGKGLLVAKQGVVISSGARLVPVGFDTGVEGTAYKTHLDPANGGLMRIPLVGTDCIGFASLGPIRQDSADWVCGIAFANGNYTATPTGAKFAGSMITQGIDFQQPNVWLVTQPGISAFKPSSLPALNNVNARGDWIRQ